MEQSCRLKRTCDHSRRQPFLMIKAAFNPSQARDPSLAFSFLCSFLCFFFVNLGFLRIEQREKVRCPFVRGPLLILFFDFDFLLLVFDFIFFSFFSIFHLFRFASRDADSVVLYLIEKVIQSCFVKPRQKVKRSRAHCHARQQNKWGHLQKLKKVQRQTVLLRAWDVYCAFGAYLICHPSNLPTEKYDLSLELSPLSLSFLLHHPTLPTSVSISIALLIFALAWQHITMPPGQASTTAGEGTPASSGPATVSLRLSRWSSALTNDSQNATFLHHSR